MRLPANACSPVFCFFGSRQLLITKSMKFFTTIAAAFIAGTCFISASAKANDGWIYIGTSLAEKKHYVRYNSSRGNFVTFEWKQIDPDPYDKPWYQKQIANCATREATELLPTGPYAIWKVARPGMMLDAALNAVCFSN
jgi:hypothetical protein